ncbi:cupin domain-containing protein [Kiloniella sp. b19]|uniref:cupin domain-containing protein n=1 Tax=Kiloniella sp. GXU_MW_B19 TaxID=3141326 RepID=UPI0031D0707D
MELNSDFSKRILIRTSENPWRESPAAGVERKMLDRIGDEVARATTIVRFAPESAFAAHTHGGGEEFIVLEGTFQDEHADYPAGSYVRNPPTTRHTPRSDDGCTIFVKLWQFDEADRNQFDLMMSPDRAVADTHRSGVKSQQLHRDQREAVSFEVWDAGTSHELDASGGAEILVLEGELQEGGDHLTRQDWLRLPAGSHTILTSGENGVRFWIKTGHLRFV